MIGNNSENMIHFLYKFIDPCMVIKVELYT